MFVITPVIHVVHHKKMRRKTKNHKQEKSRVRLDTKNRQQENEEKWQATPDDHP
ncbi:MAG: hypothetical protein L6Q51_14455 [Cyclobacteriaceae bacterium]|nr:hypothetical protein [Cyclobacteriaceae bacterium]